MRLTIGSMPKYQPDFESFQQLARRHDRVPVYRQLLSDRITPVMAYEVIGRDEHAFLLESAQVDGRSGRWSFISTRPRAVYQCRGGRAVLWRQGKALEEFSTTDALEDLSKLLGRPRCARVDKAITLGGGLVGYVSYDLMRPLESETAQSNPVDDRGLPEVSFGLYDDLIVFDHTDHTLRVISNATIDHSKVVSNDGLKSVYENACRRIDLLVQRMNQPSMLSMTEIDFASPGTVTPVANLTREQFVARAKKGLDSIHAGEIERFSPSVRLRMPSDAQPIDVYRMLRAIQPGPFLFLLKSPQCTLIGSSPESLCSVIGGGMESDPTIQLRADQSALDVLSACWPAESVSGAPKNRAMRWIDEVEPTRRGPFGGVVGWFDFAGDGQACVAQRMLIWRNGNYDGQACVEVTTDTSLSNGYEKCVDEIGGLMRSVEMATRKESAGMGRRQGP